MLGVQFHVGHFLEAERSQKIIGFDACGEFPRNERNTDSDYGFIDQFERAGGDGLPLQETLDVIQGKGFTNIDLIKGDILETCPSFSPNTRNTDFPYFTSTSTSTPLLSLPLEFCGRESCQGVSSFLTTMVPWRGQSWQ